MYSPLSRTPVVRIALPFALGIMAWHCTTSVAFGLITLLVGVASAIAFSFIGRDNPMVRYRVVPWHSLAIALISIAAGWFAAYVAAPKCINLEDVNGKVVTGTIRSVKYTQKSMSMHVESSELGSILLSTKGHNRRLRIGTDIAFRANLQETANLGNPFEFDYKQYLYNRGIIYTQHTDVAHIVPLSRNDGILYKVGHYRETIENLIKSTDLSHDAKGFMIALILGNNDYITPQSHDSFSKAGAAHILAVSGLHVGIIAMIIWCVLFPLDYYGFRRLRLLITIAFIALYAIFTGLSPSVVRASIMTTFTFAEFLLFRRNTSLNALFVAALIILIFSPFSLFEVGFQLSFCTVAAILLIVPKLREIVNPKNRILNYILSSIWVSLAAMISTSAITAYYFHSIPLLAFGTNLIILPALPVIMVVYIIYVVILIAFGEFSIFTAAIDGSYQVIYHIVSFVSGLGISHIDSVYISLANTFIYLAMVAVFCLWLYFRRRHLIYIMASLAAAMVIIAAQHIIFVPRQGLFILNDFRCTPVFYFHQHKGYLWVLDEEPDAYEFESRHKGMLAYYGINQIDVISADTVNIADGSKIISPFASIAGKNMVIINDNKWKKIRFDNPIDMDYVIVTKRYHSSFKNFEQLFGKGKIVLSGDIYIKQHQIMKGELTELAIPYYSVKDSGALTMILE